MRRTLAAALLLPLLTLGAAPVTPFADLLEPLWKTLKRPDRGPPPGLSWRLRVTPPFPASWPPKPDAPLVSYAYGAALDLTLRDAERISAPFAKVETPASGAPRVTPLAQVLEVVDTQGFHPVGADEAQRAQAAFATGPALRAGKLDEARPAWCAWWRGNGAIVAQLREQHAAFLDALACDGEQK